MGAVWVLKLYQSVIRQHLCICVRILAGSWLEPAGDLYRITVLLSKVNASCRRRFSVETMQEEPLQNILCDLWFSLTCGTAGNLAADAVGLMELKVVSEYIPAGDHEVVICDVVDWKTLVPAGTSSTPLYTGYLRQEGLL